MYIDIKTNCVLSQSHIHFSLIFGNIIEVAPVTPREEARGVRMYDYHYTGETKDERQRKDSGRSGTTRSIFRRNMV